MANDDDDDRDVIPPRTFRVLVLRDQLFSYNEIAQQLGITKSTVATHLWMARKLGLASECDGQWAKKARRCR